MSRRNPKTYANDVVTLCVRVEARSIQYIFQQIFPRSHFARFRINNHGRTNVLSGREVADDVQSVRLELPLSFEVLDARLRRCGP